MKQFLLLLLLFCSASVFAQNLLTSKQHADYSYIFKISDKQAELLYRHEAKIDKSYFHTLVDSFPYGEKYDKKLENGHYLKIRIEKELMYVDFTTIYPFAINLIDNKRDLCVQLQNKDGSFVSDAEVFVENRRIRFDENTQSYRKRKSNREGLLMIKHKGQSVFYDLRSKNHYYRNRIGFWNTLLYRTPIRYVWSPIRFVVLTPIHGVKSIVRGYPVGNIDRIAMFGVNIFERVACIFDSDFCDNYRAGIKSDCYGYMLTNKPKYKPGDTVKVKAFIVNYKGKAIGKQISVGLHYGWERKKTLFKELKPYKKGAYVFSFILHDSLNLNLDKTYRLNIFDKRGRNLMSTNFTYEDYELKQNRFLVEPETKTHFAGNDLSVVVKALDENDLYVMDASFELVVTTTLVNDFFAKSAFVKDTLYTLNQKLNPDSETEIFIPDSVFPDANLSYKISAIMRNSDNETLEVSVPINYYSKHEKIEVKLLNDSIKFDYKNCGKSQKDVGKLFASDNFGNRTFLRNIELPHTEKLNTIHAFYEVETKKLQRKVGIHDFKPEINCFSQVHNDSIYISVSNPKKITFSYFIYRNQNEIERGTAKDLNFVSTVDKGEFYHVSLQYLWAGNMRNQEFSFGIEANVLNVKLSQPSVVYPGQKAKIEVAVTDFQGLPVSGVDLTCWALTKKFSYKPPSLPYFTPNKKERKQYKSWNMSNMNASTNDYQFVLSNFPFLSEKVDSIEFYKFRFPGKSIYQTSIESEDSITQFAPFIMNNGVQQKIKVIYLDYFPVYFDWAQATNPYSFRTTEGWHRLQLITNSHKIYIDSLYFEKGKKTIISLEDTLVSDIVENVVDTKFLSKHNNNLKKHCFPINLHHNHERFAWIEQGDNLFWVRKNGIGNSLIGPVQFSFLNYFNEDSTRKYSFFQEPGYAYSFDRNYMKLQCFNSYSFYTNSYNWQKKQNLYDEVLTKKKIRQAIEKAKQDDFQKLIKSSENAIKTQSNCKLTIQSQWLDSMQNQIKYLLLIPVGKPEIIQIYTSKITDFENLLPGNYKIFAYIDNYKIYSIESGYLNEFGKNFCRVDSFARLKYNILHSSLHLLITEWLSCEKYHYDSKIYARKIYDALFYDGNIEIFESGYTVSGIVRCADDNLGLPGVTVMVKGTPHGTVTDFDGRYTIKVPSVTSKLVFPFVGMNTMEMFPAYGNGNDVYLEASSLGLDEVVVTALGVSRAKRSLSFSVSDAPGLLQGKAAGVQITQSLENASNIIIRGAASLSENKNPLIIIDGKIYSGDLSTLDKNLITDMQVLKGAEAAGIYGARAANGIVIISTKGKKLPNLSSENSLITQMAQNDVSSIRSNFSDYAYWQPKLRTDANGKASFEVTFPDDITSWQTYVYAMNGKRQTGQTAMTTKAVKPLVARLSTPRFMIIGDKINSIGKVFNYTLDSLNLKSVFSVNDTMIAKKEFFCHKSFIDTLEVKAQTNDTLLVKYEIKRNDGYFDGEERKIPIFGKGVNISKGKLDFVLGDTTMLIKPKKHQNDFSLTIDNSQLNVLEKDVHGLMNYSYLCNEQLASKLKAFLMHKLWCDYKGKKFKFDSDIKRIIKKLEKNKNPEKMWGWWNKTSTVLWISAHVYEALLQAKKAGYETNFSSNLDKFNLATQIQTCTSFRQGSFLLKLAKDLGFGYDFNRMANSLERLSNARTIDKFRFIELKQSLGLTYEKDSLFKHLKKTALGNIYFEDNTANYRFYNNEYQLSLLAYKVLRNDSTTSADTITKIRNYFFEKRTKRYYLNTYETSKLLEIMFPELIEASNAETPKIELRGSKNLTIEQYPYKLNLNQGDSVIIDKKGRQAVFISQTYIKNKQKQTPHSPTFEIETNFDGDYEKSSLKVGRNTVMNVKVNVKAKAEYVMMEIPIPAGCSYTDKTIKSRYEIHREHFKDKVSIFCESLEPGRYTFQIHLTPRYTGELTLNPAKVELMYFPMIFANNSLKKITVIGKQ